MAKTISGTFTAALQATVTNTSLDSTNNTYKVNHAFSASLASGTSPDGEGILKATSKQLTAGAYTVNFAAFPDDEAGTVDITGKKIRGIMIEAASANANPIVVIPGASNGLDLGSADEHWTIAAGGARAGYFKDDAPAIASGDRTLDISSSDTDAIFTISVIYG